MCVLCMVVLAYSFVRRVLWSTIDLVDTSEFDPNLVLLLWYYYEQSKTQHLSRRALFGENHLLFGNKCHNDKVAIRDLAWRLLFVLLCMRCQRDRAGTLNRLLDDI